MGIFGSGPTAGQIAVCAQCGNKAEVKIYQNNNPDPICEDCYNGNLNLERKIVEKSSGSSKPNYTGSSIPVYSEGTDERELYIRTICNKATDQWVDSFIHDVVAKQVLVYDWRKIISNERWFSLLDLRRFALEVDPNLDKPEPPASIRFFDTVKKPRKLRGRPKKATKVKEEPSNV